MSELAGVDDDAPEAPSRRVLQRLSFVIILMGVGAIVATVIMSRMPQRYESTAVVGLPSGTDAEELFGADLQNTFVGEDGDLRVEFDGSTVRLIGAAETASDAEFIANETASDFVALSDDPGIRLLEEAPVPTSPTSPNRLLGSLIGVGSGALLGLLLQPALRPRQRDPDAEYIPAWTSEASPPDSVEEFAPSHPEEQAAGPGEPDTAEDPDVHDDNVDVPDGVAPIPEETSAQVAEIDATDADELWMVTIPAVATSSKEPDADDAMPSDEAAAAETDDEPSDEAEDSNREHNERDDDETDDDTDPLDTDSQEAEVAETGDADQEDPIEPAPEEPAPEEPAPEEPEEPEAGQTEPEPEPAEPAARGFRSLVERTTANIDPLIDRFATGDERFSDEVLAASRPEDPIESLDDLYTWKPPIDLPVRARRQSEEVSALVARIEELSDDLVTARRNLDRERRASRRDRQASRASHVEETSRLRDEVDQLRDELTSAEERRDTVRSRLEDRVQELEFELATTSDQLERFRRRFEESEQAPSANAESLAEQNAFLEDEVERYQRSLDSERVDHAKAVAQARLENQEELDQLHRDHRQTLAELAQSNRSLLTQQRAEGERVMASLEAEHQQALDQLHRTYEERISQAKSHHRQQREQAEARVLADLEEGHQRALETLRRQLDTAVDEQATLRERVRDAARDEEAANRRADQARTDVDAAWRRSSDERRRLEHRVTELESLLARSEERLSEERRRTNEVIRNLLQESATTAAQAEWARKNLAEEQEQSERDHQGKLAELEAQLAHLERSSADREADLEATIAALRRGSASPNEDG
ncbi:MAG: hypothetical protein AAF567_15120 [Actinomycetota bacterium]